MHRFFAEDLHITDNRITITGGDVNHIRNVLRMDPGDHICIVAGQDGKEYDCEILSLDGSRVETVICGVTACDRELQSRIVLFQGLPKSDKMELIIQKAVELGAESIIPVITERTIVKLDPKKEENKRRRWMSISESAAKQSGRLCIPEVHKAVSFDEALRMARELDVNLIPYELAEGMDRTRELMSGIQPGRSVGIFIGPEGGFAADEVRKAVAAGVEPVTLGKRILRTETAGLATLAMLVYNLER